MHNIRENRKKRRKLEKMSQMSEGFIDLKATKVNKEETEKFPCTGEKE